MLTALELVGFKSFADRTRFDFPDGITVVVGPNGSGKSNIVDAIKWVLGAQSAKSLRGGEMTDVIFKGSAGSGRKPASSAEATLVFDNSGNHFDYDAPEVHVTRRVFRSGESEYLINGQPVRLKDIKDLFRGTGVGVDAYSLIEQGKVDRMLQASPKDRRAIFEEAAGISRFKAKKQETERRLARVDQNLVRLADIVREVESRLNSLRSQAGKAERYREATVRLKELRTQSGISEWLDIHKRLTRIVDERVNLNNDADSVREQLSNLESELRQSDLTLHEIATAAQSTESSRRDIQQRIAVLQTGQQTSRQRRGELEDDRARIAARLIALRQRAEDTRGQLDILTQQVTAAANQLNHIRDQAQQAEETLATAESQWQTAQKTASSIRQDHLHTLRLATELSNTSAALQSQQVELEKSVQNRQKRLNQAEQVESTARQQLDAAEGKLAHLRDEAIAAQQQYDAAQVQLEETRRTLTSRQDDAIALQGRLRGSREKLLVLEELQRRSDASAVGAREFLQMARHYQTTPQPGLVKGKSTSLWMTVRGMVADVIDVDMHLAPLIDVALGNLAQAVVLDDGQIIQLIRDQQLDVEGRVTLIRLDRLPPRRPGERVQLDGLPGILGRADRLVRCDGIVEPLARYLLGTTWIVDTLATAMDLGHYRGSGLRFVTSNCQLLDADGSVTLGTLNAGSGLVARRSEIQVTQGEIQHYAYQYQQAEEEIERLQENIESQTQRVRRFDEINRQRAAAASAQQIHVQTALNRLEQLAEAKLHLQNEVEGAQAEFFQTQQKLSEANSQSSLLQNKLHELDSQILIHQQQVEQLDAARRDAEQSSSNARVTLAKAEQRLEGLQASLDQISRDQNERRQAVQDAVDSINGLVEKGRNLDLQILDATSQLAMAMLHVEDHDAKLRELAAVAAAHRQDHNALQKNRDATDRQLNRLLDKLAKIEGEQQQLDSNQINLVTRFRDDYNIDLTDTNLHTMAVATDRRTEIDSEIAKLREEITAIGSVNMEALRELDELHSRYTLLHGQYTDLVDAKDSLIKVIEKINIDSRRLFVETLEAIRKNFQVLYRKSFGGGSADIVLEQGVDVLECGVDIIATPPGKTALSNSLLSGGEKALTAVALLLAIFQFRPSPFCVLDEVDAPFDEANIGRFVSVLTEFLDWTKFIIVTHSKKTMTAATTLYGVTMQESGISKQVSVRFDEVGDDGEILTAAESKNATRKAA